MSDEILTVQEVAALLKVADKTVYTMAQREEIPAFKIRGQWRFKREEIDSWIATLQRGPKLTALKKSPATPRRKRTPR
jgi:excisionase family DNA binding protein